jgi:hypothetical protein
VYIKKKTYKSPTFEKKQIKFVDDVLSDSQPRGGDLGYWEEETFPTTTNPFIDPDDGFEW